MNGGYAPIRRGLLDHLIDRRIHRDEYHLYVCMIMRADHRTGIWRGSAGIASSLFDVPLRTARDCFEKLEEKGYIKRFMKPGSKSAYPILINKYECSEGVVKGKRLNAETTISLSEVQYEEVDLSCSDGSGDNVSHGSSHGVSLGAALQEHRTEKEEKTIVGTQNQVPTSGSENPTSSAPPKNGENTKLKLIHDQIRNVIWPVYLESCGKNGKMYTLTDKRMGKAVSRFRECMKKAREPKIENATSLMLGVIEAASKSKFHNGENEQREKYLEWERHLFPSQEKTEWWIMRWNSLSPS